MNWHSIFWLHSQYKLQLLLFWVHSISAEACYLIRWGGSLVAKRWGWRGGCGRSRRIRSSSTSSLTMAFSAGTSFPSSLVRTPHIYMLLSLSLSLMFVILHYVLLKVWWDVGRVVAWDGRTIFVLILNGGLSLKPKRTKSSNSIHGLVIGTQHIYSQTHGRTYLSLYIDVLDAGDTYMELFLLITNADGPRLLRISQDVLTTRSRTIGTRGSRRGWSCLT